MNRLNRLAVNEEGFGFDPTTGESYTINESGRIIMMGLKENRTARDIAQTLSDTYEITPEEAGPDIADFIDQLHSCRLY